jgi:hypothetical protein
MFLCFSPTRRTWDTTEVANYFCGRKRACSRYDGTIRTYFRAVWSATSDGTFSCIGRILQPCQSGKLLLAPVKLWVNPAPDQAIVCLVKEFDFRYPTAFDQEHAAKLYTMHVGRAEHASPAGGRSDGVGRA